LITAPVQRPSLMPQCFQRIEFGGALRREQSRDEADERGE
jgi:hypothetical protein